MSLRTNGENSGVVHSTGWGGTIATQTWLNGCLWRRSAPGVQLQQCLLKGLAEGVLEVGNWDTVGAVALSVAVCRWWSKQLVCMTAK